MNLSAFTLPVLAVAVALAGAAGLRAFVPLFFVCHALRLDLLSDKEINPALLPYMSQMQDNSTYMILFGLMVVEIIAEKIPSVARTLDLPLLLLRMLAAGVAAFAVLPVRDFGTSLTAAIVLGGIGAVPIANLQAGQNVDERAPSYLHVTATTLVDGIALGSCSTALQMPYAGLIFLHVSMWTVTIFIQRWRDRLMGHLSIKSMAPPPELPDDWTGSPVATGRLREP